MDNTVLRVASALERLRTGISELKSLNVIRSRKWISDFGEWLVAETYEGSLAESKTQKGWDVKVEDRNIQVKTSFEPDDPANRWSFVSDPKGFDALVLIVLTDAFKIREFYKVPATDLRPLLKEDKQGLRLNWNDIAKWKIRKVDIANYERLSLLFE